VELELLGPIQVRDHATERPVAGRQKALLALLAIEAPRVVSAGRLVEAVWPDTLPANPTNALQGRISQLRKVLEPAGNGLIAQREPGYALQAPPEAIDARRFEELAAEGSRALRMNDHTAAAELTGRALGLWRGDALEGFAHEAWAMAEAARLEEQRLGVREDRFAALLGLGEHRELIPELEAFVHHHPLRERPRGQLMLALYRAGRQADALDVFQRGRRILRDELGIDPGHQLRDLERRVLEQDPDLAWPVAPSPHGAAVPTVPARTPNAVSDSATTTDLSPLAVGRGPESSVLLDAWQAARDGTGRIVVLTGEPGTGKSHLADALVHRVRQDPGALVVLGRCAETDGAPPFWPWVQVIRQLAQELGPDRLPSALGLGAAYVAQIVPEVREQLPETALPVSHSGPSARFAVCDAVTSLLCRSATNEPLLVVLEDLHQADPASLDLVDLLSDQLDRTSCLLVVTTRTAAPGERLHGSLSRLAGRPAVAHISLQGLPDDALTQLVHDRFGGAGSDAMVQALRDRTDGNPLYVTELLRLVERSGGGDMLGATDRILAEVPRTLRDVIARRLRQLPDETLEVLQAAAVIGRDAPTAWVADMLNLDPVMVLDLLEPAVAAGIVDQADAWATEYRFQHVLVRDVVVAELPTRRRAQLHADAAEVLEGLPSERTLSAIAVHRKHAIPLGQVEPAIDAAIAAAEEAARLFAVEQAEGHLQDALEFNSHHSGDPSRELAIQARLTFLYQETDGFMSPRVRETADRARHLAGRATDSPEVVGVVYSLWAYWMNRAMFTQALAIAEELVEAGASEGDVATRIAGHFTRGQTRFMMGSLAEAEPDLLAALELVGQLDGQEGHRRGIAQAILDAQVGLAHPLWLLGRDDQAERVIRGAMAHADQTSNHYASAHSRLFMCWLTALRQEAESTLTLSSQAIDLCDQHGFGLVSNVAGVFQGWAMAAAGDPARGIGVIMASIERLEADGFHMLRPLHLGLLADAFDLAGRSEEAGRTISQAVDVAERTGERMHLAELRRRRAHLAAAGTVAQDVRKELLAARAIAESQGATALIQRIDRDLRSLDAAN
jgi:DNA-binding SARP family transcriptional activator